MAFLRTVYQTRDALEMALRSTFREIGVLLAFVIIFPLGFLFFLGQIATPSLRAQVLVGSVMMEMALLNINVVAQGIGQDKLSKLYDLWVSFPMSPVVYVLSLALSVMPFSFLSAAITLSVGALYFHLALLPLIGPLLIGLLLVWASTIGIGFLIGVYGKSPRAINTNAQFVGIVMTFFAPIFYPVSVLPLPLQYVAYAWPLTWGSAMLVAIIHGAVASALIDGAVLGAYSAAWAVLIGMGLRWRQV
ncbi:MAG TPA: ABC transporter permease [Thermoplasmata archaeon]|nr:ABC transporter permease [Thermoplasmata archaeon]